ncbi:lysozyme [Escherichia phage vB_EcoP_HC-25922]|uniref:Lysozyme n=2 Tax=Suseptimavirus TaxID=3044836 RepID=A0A8F3C9B7_9CAUD|nr:endolysin [Escherichia phage vB_EcoP_SU7]YP_010673188.1 endolysin [Escherichia phage IME267]QWY14120.1 lysozyme [Escherichia phage vB_EcoP_SU7]QYC96894.1 lysin [Escherichia phage IME267]
MDAIALPPVQMSLSPAGMEFIMKHEGMRTKAYKDSAGIWTICVGATRDMNGYPVRQGLTYSIEDCLALLDRDTQDSVRATQKNIRVPMLAHEFDAVTSFNFNVGGGALSASKLRKVINGDVKGDVYSEFLRWDKITVKGVKQRSPGLHNRRVAEANLYTTGKY